jgi:hypothetical protein
MKTIKLIPAALTFVMAGALLWAADDQSATQPSAAQPPSSQSAPSLPSGQPSAAGSQAVQTPPANWTSLSGTVQSVDPVAKVLQIKEESGSIVEVPMDTHVTIKRDGAKVKLSQVQTGDTITLAKRSMSAEEKAKSSAN